MSTLIRLKIASNVDVNIDGMYGEQITSIVVKVKNVAFSKDVRAAYNSGGAAWQQIVLGYLGHYGNYDLFGNPDGPFFVGQLVVSCTQAGVTDYDNDGGKNYFVGDNRGVAGGNVVLNQAVAHQGLEAGGGFTFQTSWIEGSIYVNNLSYAKRVGIRYTANNWATWQDVDATYGGPAASEYNPALPGDAEQWNFKTPEYNYDSASDTFQFAIYHQRLDTGDWFWDNNFSQNYQLSKVNGSTLL